MNALHTTLNATRHLPAAVIPTHATDPIDALDGIERAMAEHLRAALASGPGHPDARALAAADVEYASWIQLLQPARP